MAPYKLFLVPIGFYTLTICFELTYYLFQLLDLHHYFNKISKLSLKLCKLEATTKSKRVITRGFNRLYSEVHFCLIFFSFWPWSLKKPPEIKIEASTTSLRSEISAFIWGWAGMKIKTSRNRYLSMGHFRPSCLLNWPKSPLRLVLIVSKD